jgi:dynactin complex subunit
MKSIFSNISKENENLTLNKIHMQEQLDALSFEVETLNKKLTIVSSKKDDLIINNNAFKNENILQKKTLEKYEQLKNTKIKRS